MQFFQHTKHRYIKKIPDKLVSLIQHHMINISNVVVNFKDTTQMYYYYYIYYYLLSERIHSCDLSMKG